MIGTKGKQYMCVLFLIFILLSACSSKPDFELYKGEPLKIAVVGEPPEVGEEQVEFFEISLEEMRREDLQVYDGVFIQENNLSEAAEGEYANVYLSSTIPFFFIGTANYVPFIEKDLGYDENSDWTVGTYYAVGIYPTSEAETLKHWGYGLYNDEKTEEHINEMYSRIFKTIEGLN